MSSIYRSQEFEVSSHSKRAKLETEKVVGIDYDLVIDYHPRKANVVVDALSRKSSMTLSHI